MYIYHHHHRRHRRRRRRRHHQSSIPWCLSHHPLSTVVSCPDASATTFYRPLGPVLMHQPPSSIDRWVLSWCISHHPLSTVVSCPDASATILYRPLGPVLMRQPPSSIDRWVLSWCISHLSWYISHHPLSTVVSCPDASATILYRPLGPVLMPQPPSSIDRWVLSWYISHHPLSTVGSCPDTSATILYRPLGPVLMPQPPSSIDRWVLSWYISHHPLSTVGSCPDASATILYRPLGPVLMPQPPSSIDRWVLSWEDDEIVHGKRYRFFDDIQIDFMVNVISKAFLSMPSPAYHATSRLVRRIDNTLQCRHRKHNSDCWPSKPKCMISGETRHARDRVTSL